MLSLTPSAIHVYYIKKASAFTSNIYECYLLLASSSAIVTKFDMPLRVNG